MISNGVTTGMIFTLIICFFVPVVELFYLLLKKKQKKVLPLALAGGLGIIIGPLVGRMLIEYVLSLIIDLTKIRTDMYPLYLMIVGIVQAVSLVAGITIAIKIILPGGLTVERMISFSAGAQLVYAVIFTAMNTLNQLTVIGYISSGEFEKMAKEANNPEKRVSEIIDEYASISVVDTFMAGIIQLLLFIIIVGIIYFIYKGLYEQYLADDEKRERIIDRNDKRIKFPFKNGKIIDKMFLVSSVMAGLVYFVSQFINNILSHYVNTIVAALFMAVVAVAGAYVFKIVYKENVKIKPESMTE